MSSVSINREHIPLDERVRKLTQEVLEDESYFVVDALVRGYKGSRAVEIYVDADRGADVAELAGISRRLAFLIDSEDVIEGKYNLTVSSPGVKHGLQLPRQYGKHVGKKLEMRILSLEDEQKTELFEGTLLSVSDDSVVLETGERGKREVRFESIQEAKVVLPW